MSVEAASEAPSGTPGIPIEALASLAGAVASAASRPTVARALADLAAAARTAASAEVALVRVRNAAAELETMAVAGPAVLAAELEGSSLPGDELPEAAVDLLDDAAPGVQRVAARARLGAVLVLPIRVDGVGACLELYGPAPFTAAARLAGELAAVQMGLVLRAFAGAAGGAGVPALGLELAGEALAAALHESEPAGEVVRLAASVAAAPVGLLWERGVDGLELAASYGLDDGADLTVARSLAAEGLDTDSDGLPEGCAFSTTLALGEPPVGFLQLLFPPGAEPGSEQLARLRTFGVRVAHVLRSQAQARSLALELERSRALLAVVGQATAELSLAHTLETAVEHVAELLSVERVTVYLRADDDRLVAAAGHVLPGPHARVADRLLEIGLGPARRRRPLVEVADTAGDARLAEVRDAAREAGIDGAAAAPLLVHGEVIGLLAAYPERGRRLSDGESALLSALAAQLAVAVQNAQLHERTSELSSQREAALASEREAARRLGALYEISRSFAQSLSLEATLEALARTVVDVLDVDAAVIRMPDARREQLVPRALHVKDAALAEAMRTILFRPQPFGASSVQRLFRERVPFRLRRRPALGEGSDLLAPFLERGWTGVVVPVATPAEVIAALTVLSFRPGSPISSSTVDAAVAIAGQAALAIDNARLYQQQKEFADTMQRSLLPRSRPSSGGLEVGEVYESSARVDVGGDIYDFMTLEDGRLAVVLGDVTGHGVEATADMAMAKFVFRSLAREHPDPGDFLAAANDVIVDEIAAGKFITMTYLAIDGEGGTFTCAGAGHPPSRLVHPDGSVRGLEARGLALGVDVGQEYEELQAELPSGAAVVVYTDGVLEARRGGELYGVERLDALLAANRELPPHALARVVAEDCRAFADGELADDLAVVVIRRR